MNFRSIILILTLLAFRPIFAEHLPGGSIHYTCLGGNYFRIELQLLRECSGFPMVAQTLRFTNDCGVEFNVANLQPYLVESVEQICSDQEQNSTCNGGSIYGYELAYFQTELYLSPCASWTIHWSICCRQPSVNIQANPGLYIETRINNVAEACSDSPRFNQNDVPHVCVGQAVFYDAGATDANGHELQYSFIDARFASPFPVSVNYVFPNYGGEPVAGMTLDPATGQIAFTPTAQGYIVVVVQVDEYNATGVWIGSVMRDFPFVATSCSNTVPPSGTGDLTNVNGTATIEGENAMSICAGSSACATMQFTDPDAAQTLTATSSVAQAIPGAILTTTGTNPLTVEICWDTVDVGPGPYFFTITVMDDACPIMGSMSYVYTVEVQGSYAGMNGTAHACSVTIPFTLLDSLEGSPPPDGYWTDPEGMGHSGFFNNSVDGPGIYTYTVGSGNCTASAELEIIFLEESDPLCLMTSTTTLNAPAFQIHPNPTYGSIDIEGLDTRNARIEILDQHGRVVMTASPSKQENMRLVLPSDLADGMYLLRIHDDLGLPRTHQFILQR